jgi:Zn-dependent M32 family carboxypeptidase
MALQSGSRKGVNQMKITKRQLRQIIKEEYSRVLLEQEDDAQSKSDLAQMFNDLKQTIRQQKVLKANVPIVELLVKAVIEGAGDKKFTKEVLKRLVIDAIDGMKE